MKYLNLNLVGTSHIAKQSLQEVEKAIRDGNPDMVALELDPGRLKALLTKKKSEVSVKLIKRIGFKGYLFAKLGGWAEKKLGDSVGVAPGSEMLRAVKVCRELKIPIVLMDQNIEITLRKFSKVLSWKERWNFVKDLFKGLVLRKKEVDFDLSKVPSQKIIKQMTSKVKDRYPNIYRVLVTERNEIMARRLAFLMHKDPEKNIVAIVGAGHEKEMISLIKKYLKSKKA